MANTTLVLTLAFVFPLSAFASAKADRVHKEGYLGEKDLSSYSERYDPLIFQDIYRGTMTFSDNDFFQNYFDAFLFESRPYAFFLKSELSSGQVCSNEVLSEHFDQIRFSYRLITLSYLLEGQWHLKLISDHFKLKNGCNFELSAWPKNCRPKSEAMKKFVERLSLYRPVYEESMPLSYMKEQWWNEYKKRDFKWYSQYRMASDCRDKCSEATFPEKLKQICEEDQRLMSLICSEDDEVYGLSQNRDAYYLLGLSNIINTYNKRGEALGCLRRFSELMAHKEVRYPVLNHLFPALQSFLRQRYQERFLQGRTFFYGASQEFEDKGLSNLFVKSQPLQIEKAPELKSEVSEPLKVADVKKPVEANEAPKVAEVPKNEPVKEIQKQVKSAFLIASEIRDAQDLDQVEVDMLKLKYDYVFSLHMINTLSERLKTFMTREALTEMSAYDKLGSKDGPVPLLFLKFMIDMQEHQGLWNLIAVLGDKFFVSNEIDSLTSPRPQLIKLVNSQSSNGQWQIYIIKQ